MIEAHDHNKSAYTITEREYPFKERTLYIENHAYMEFVRINKHNHDTYTHKIISHQEKITETSPS